MKKIIIVIALASLIGGCGVALAHGAGDTPMHEKLGLPEPTMLPDSSFYFLKEWGRSVKMFFTFDPVKKADLSLRITDEKIAELDKLIDDKPDEKETLQHALDNYLAAQDDLAARLEKLQGKNKNVDSLLEKLADRVVEHRALFGELEKRTGEESVKNAKQKIGKTADDALLLDQKKFKEKLEKKIKEEDEEIEIDDFLENLEIELEDLSDDLNELEENDGKKATSTQKTMEDKDGKEMNKNKGRNKDINFCAEIYLPVCGKNGKTYSNECFAKMAAADVSHKGICSAAQPKPSLNVISPNGKEEWKEENIYEVRWEGGNREDQMSILLFDKDRKQVASIIGDTMANAGRFSWDLKIDCGCPEQTREFVKQGQYKIKIRAPFASYEDESDGLFTIMAPNAVNPAPQEFKIEADDSGFYPTNSITVAKGTKVKIIFTVRTTNVYYGGLDFQSPKFSTVSAKPGNSVEVEFIAAESFTINSYWPKTFAFKASLKVEIR